MGALALFRRFVREESGQDLVEYGMLAALIALLVFSAVQTAGVSINGMWTRIAGTLATIA